MWADYLPPPKNKFVVKVNDDDYYNLVKETIDFDPTKLEIIECESIKLNGNKFGTDNSSNHGRIPWLLD